MTPHERVRVAAKAFVSPKSVERYLAGKSMRPAIARSIESAMRALGFAAHLRRAHGAAEAPTTSAA